MLYPATWLVLATVAVILILFGMGYFWARNQGQLDNVEEAKHNMLAIEHEARPDE